MDRINEKKEGIFTNEDYLDSQRYKTRTVDEQSAEARVLLTETSKESKQQAGLRHWKSNNEYVELAQQPVRNVVDGVEDLQAATTSLFARHNPELNEEPREDERPGVAPLPQQAPASLNVNLRNSLLHVARGNNPNDAHRISKKLQPQDHKGLNNARGSSNAYADNASVGGASTHSKGSTVSASTADYNNHNSNRQRDPPAIPLGDYGGGMYNSSERDSRVDDRITPQTLQVLLKGSRKVVARQIKKDTRKNVNISFETTAEQRERNAKMLQSTAMAAKTRQLLGPSKGAADGKSKNKGVTTLPPAGRLRTATPPLNSDAKAVGGDEELDVQAFYRNKPQSNSTTTQKLKNTIKYAESPGLADAHEARYATAAGGDITDGNIGTAFNSTLTNRPPPPVGTFLATYPQALANAEGQEDRRRLSPIPADSSKDRQLRSFSRGEVDALLDEEEAARLANCDTAAPKDRKANEINLDIAFTAASRGDDSALVQQLVQFYSGRLQALQQRERPELTGDLLEQHQRAIREDEGQDGPAERSDLEFSILNSVLSVSREYEKIRQSQAPSKRNKDLSTNQRALPPDASQVSRNRQAIIKRLTTLDSTLIPEQFWVTIQDRAPQALTRSINRQKKNNNSNITENSTQTGKRAADTDVASTNLNVISNKTVKGFSDVGNGENESDASAIQNKTTSVVFPAAIPSGRAQVYLLADTIDTMLSSNPNQLRILADPAVATSILPEEAGEWANEPKQKTTSAEENNILLAPELRHKSEEVYELYANAASDVTRIIDAGLVELVRQVSSSCVERGALLDFLRQTLVDIADSLVSVLSHTKKRAYAEAEERLELRKEVNYMEGEMDALRQRVAELENAKQELEENQKKMALKVERFDDLCARVEAKKRRFEVHESDEHQAFLVELEKDLADAAQGALSTLYNETVRMRTGEEKPEKKAEAPSVIQAREAAIKAKEAPEKLYQGSTKLIKALREATSSVDAACGPLYDQLQLSKLSARANLASTRWVEIARSIGAHEKELTHRQKVFDIFNRWCEAFQKEDANKTEAARSRTSMQKSNNFLEDSVSLDNEEMVERLGMDADTEARASFTSLPGAAQAVQAQRAEHVHVQFEEMQERRRRENEDQDRRTRQHLLENNMSPELYEYGNSVLRSIHYISAEDLQEMGETDCSAAEVNKLFEREFDFKKYLSPKWEPPKLELNLSDVVELLHETDVALQEITLRMRAMAESAVLKRGVEPPLRPPQHPDEACILCGRRDTSQEDIKKRQDKMQLLAKEVQKKVDFLSDKCQKAESEREMTLSELKRVTNELELHTRREEELRNQLHQYAQGLLSPNSNKKGGSTRNNSPSSHSPSKSRRGSMNSMSGQLRMRKASNLGINSASIKREGKGFNSNNSGNSSISSPNGATKENKNMERSHPLTQLDNNESVHSPRSPIIITSKTQSPNPNLSPNSAPVASTSVLTPSLSGAGGSGTSGANGSLGIQPIMKATSSFRRGPVSIATPSPDPEQEVSVNSKISDSASSGLPPQRRETMAKKASIQNVDMEKLPETKK